MSVELEVLADGPVAPQKVIDRSSIGSAPMENSVVVGENGGSFELGDTHELIM